MKDGHLEIEETVVKTGFLLKNNSAAIGHCRVDSKQEGTPLE